MTDFVPRTPRAPPDEVSRSVEATALLASAAACSECVMHVSIKHIILILMAHMDQNGVDEQI